MNNTVPGDIAIIGMACRFPGAADYNEFWLNLLSGVASVSEVPGSRWDWRAYFGHPNREPGKTNVCYGGFIEDIDKFDPGFFAIPPREADYMDPQHRLFLECVWHAIEDAGYRASQLAGTRTGVYCGVTKNDYAELMRERRVEIDPFIGTGTVHSLITNRVSFFLNLRGPSEIVNTACSSSLVALSRAIADMQLGRCDCAIVGGVNALLSPTMTISFSRSGMLAVDGKIKTFDKGADGFVRGEGVAALLIKPLAAAQAAGDSIWATIKAVAVNHGGRAPFLTSPTPEAQGEVVSAAIQESGFAKNTISFIECHGTGTRIGDPIEIEGLKAAFCRVGDGRKGNVGERGVPKYCALGSVKPNIGHLESAAGLAGLIKVILAMRHRMLPGQLNFEALNPYIDLEDTPFYVVQGATPWGGHPTSPAASPLRAGVSGFGMGGVNAHVLLEEPPDPGPPHPPPAGETFIVPLSAKPRRLLALLRRHRDWLTRHQVAEGAETTAASFLRDLAFTLQVGREAFDERVAFVVRSLDELLCAIDSYLLEQADPNVFHAETTDGAISQGDPATAELRLQALEWVRRRADFDANARPAIEQGARRLRLPGYPFERRRCWFPEAPPAQAAVSTEATPGARPADASSRTPARHEVSLAKDEFYLRQHRIRGRTVVPASAHFELIARLLTTVSKPSQGIEFSEIYWLQPWLLVVGSLVSITLKERGDGWYAYTVHDGDVEYVKGRCRVGLEPLGEPPAYSPIQVQRVVSSPELYRSLSESGVEHGPLFQVVETMQLGEGRAAAQARWRDARRDVSDLVLNPCLIDGVFQVAAQLSLADGDPLDSQHVPFYLDRATFYDRIPEQFHIEVATSPDARGQSLSYDMSIRDAEHDIIAVFEGFRKRRLKPMALARDAVAGATAAPRAPAAATPATESAAPHHYTVAWRLEPAKCDRDVQGCVVICSPSEGYLATLEDYLPSSYAFMSPAATPSRRTVANHYTAAFDDSSNLRCAFEAIQRRQGPIDAIVYLIDRSTPHAFEADWNALSHAANCLAIAKSLIMLKPSGTVNFLCCVNESCENAPLDHGLAGFARTLAYEYPKISMQLMVADSEGSSADALARQIEDEIRSHHSALRLVSYTGGKRRVQEILPVVPPSDRPMAAKYRDDGVVLIFGGAGGLGRIFSKHIASHSNGHVVLLGRRPLTSEMEVFLRSINGAKEQVVYRSVDVTNAAQVDTAIKAIRAQYGGVTGVIYAAGIIDDNFILRKDVESFKRVLGTKLLGCINVDIATRKDALDYFLAFSSVAALMPNHGQSDYASGNSFLDAYMARRNDWRRRNLRSGDSIAINWPLWREGGMGVSEQGERHFEQVFGMKPLGTSAGIRLVDKLVSENALSVEGIDQIVIIHGERKKIDKHLGILA